MYIYTFLCIIIHVNLPRLPPTFPLHRSTALHCRLTVILFPYNNKFSCEQWKFWGTWTSYPHPHTLSFLSSTTHLIWLQINTQMPMINMNTRTASKLLHLILKPLLVWLHLFRHCANKSAYSMIFRILHYSLAFECTLCIRAFPTHNSFIVVCL